MSHLAEFDAILEQVERSFIEDAEDRLAAMERCVERVRGQTSCASEAMAELRRDTHTLKGAGAAFGFPAVTVVAHRLENYLAETIELSPAVLDDIQRYLDSLQDIVAGRRKPSAEEASLLLRTLPPPHAHKSGQVPLGVQEALVVTSSRIIGRLVAEALVQRGVRAVITQSSLEGFALALRAKPDLVIVSATMAELSGIDLARALTAMAATHTTPVAVLTSFSDRDLAHQGLPPGIPLLHIGPKLGSDLETVLGRCGAAHSRQPPC
jgi:CheY-like chemotaxis protein/HPt (histidine-containing phosphotransfer) domain-containing protein